VVSDTASPPTALLHGRGIRLYPGKPSFDATIFRGEIVGLAGLEGHGQEKFLLTLCGLSTLTEGLVEVSLSDGKTVSIKNLSTAAKAGVAYLPRDRKQGIFPALSVLDNFRIATLSDGVRLGILDHRVHRSRLAQFRERLSIVFASPTAPITSLSGGNQQKILLARWMAASPRVLLLNDPTRGIDMATKFSLYKVFRETVSTGETSLVLLSTEIEELQELCHRVLVFRDDTLFTELRRPQITRASILTAMFGRIHGE
jgi:ribose transport system ATP-binding protein